MIASERRRRILEWVDQAGSVGVDELSGRLGVSPMTVWRDLNELSDQGLVRRVRGGVVRAAGETEAEARVDAKRRQNWEQKEAIAALAARRFVAEGEILILEGGTTVGAMVPHLQAGGLTVLSNSLDILTLGAASPAGLNLIGSGGVLRARSRTFVGPQAERFFEDYRAQKFFLSATGLTLEEGLTDPNPLEIQVKQVMARRSAQVIVLLDSSKFGLHSLMPILPLENIHALVTDAGAPRELLAALEQQGIEVCIAS